MVVYEERGLGEACNGKEIRGWLDFGVKENH